MVEQPSQDNETNNHDNSEEINLIDLFNIVWSRKKIILILGPLFGVFGIIIAFVSDEVYRSETLLAPAAEQGQGGGLSALAGQFGGLASMAGISLGGGNDTMTALATLESRRFLEPFLEKNNLRDILFYNKYDDETKTWDTKDGTPPSNEEVHERFTESLLKLSENKKTGLVTVAIEYTDPEFCANIVNQLPKELNRYLRFKALTETQKNLAYLEEQLGKTQVLEIKQSLYSLIESETQNAMLANAKEEYSLKVIDPGYVPEKRIKPRRALIVIASGMLGGFFGIFLCFVLHFVEVAKRASAKPN